MDDLAVAVAGDGVLADDGAADAGALLQLKGSPDVIGGPGLTTRRYAAYPFRGYRNIGFRLVAKGS